MLGCTFITQQSHSRIAKVLLACRHGNSECEVADEDRPQSPELQAKAACAKVLRLPTQGPLPPAVSTD